LSTAAGHVFILVSSNQFCPLFSAKSFQIYVESENKFKYSRFPRTFFYCLTLQDLLFLVVIFFGMNPISHEEVSSMGRDKHQIKASAIGHGSERMKFNRRQFMKLGAAATASGALLSATGHANPRTISPPKSPPLSVSLNLKDNPLRITDKCKRMPQKNTIFARQLWDFEFLQRIESSIDRSRREEYKDTKGWTQLDEALDEAAWSVDHKFASGSEGGQPHSMAYAWDEPARRRKVTFIDAADASKKVKKAARYLGASLVGITAYDPLWTYSELIKEEFEFEDESRQEGPPEYEIFVPEFPFEPKSAVVIAVEMDYETMALSPSSLESAATGLGYSHMCEVGYSLATFIRALGYRAFANGNDVSLSVPYAIAAGLGELGRHGMLITREFGPRVRLVKVFTELELEPDPPISFGVWEFCKSCKRCAEACPSKAISDGEPTLEGKTISNNPGALKWYIDPEKCIQFWRDNGTDCANCIAVCPYNKINTWPHRLSTSIATLPAAPLHRFLSQLDKQVGFGNIDNLKGNASFWDED
jgi:epoxyqueuosine reductase